ncbi:MAG: hypothetical protein CVU89_05510 [Firmicutes bacterium HGW-Firmicutes-14]|nr:MAG: hypothetical protein CVU89_05510 [Firmicutes bacterium HGW-Firmicutes-14]
MIFDREAIENKLKYLDGILQDPDLVNKVIAKHVTGPFEFRHIQRVWEPGGGATLYKINCPDRSYLLKVKDKRVWIESRLEGEDDFTHIPSLLNEYNLLKFLSVEWVPQVLFYEEADNYSFLAFEHLSTFEKATSKMSAVELYEAWEKIISYTQILFESGVVHTDIHEHNICFRGKTPVLIDFEEARFLKQEVDFKQSLDWIGENQYGNVGDFPSGGYGISGLTCLNRLSEVFKSLILKKLPDFLQECNFDHNCPFNKDELQHPDKRIYQSLNLPGLRIKGQRPIRDLRMLIFRYMICKLGKHKKSIRYLDIGSNLGTFCFIAAKFPFVKDCIGIEAYEKYVLLSNILMFVYDIPKTKFYSLICGKESLEKIGTAIDFITMLSVYHHIEPKDDFIDDLKKLNTEYLLGEFATQERYYVERGSLEKEINYIQEKMNFNYCYFLTKSKDYHRPIILFSNNPISSFDRLVIHILNSRVSVIARMILFAVEKSTKF